VAASSKLLARPSSSSKLQRQARLHLQLHQQSSHSRRLSLRHHLCRRFQLGQHLDLVL
jgi:hypothetical protein